LHRPIASSYNAKDQSHKLPADYLTDVENGHYLAPPRSDAPTIIDAPTMSLILILTSIVRSKLRSVDNIHGFWAD
jgi:hypothetical protein